MFSIGKTKKNSCSPLKIVFLRIKYTKFALYFCTLYSAV